MTMSWPINMKSMALTNPPPEYALVFARQSQSGEWQQQDGKLQFAAADEKQEATDGTMGYGSGDSMPDLRDLRQEAKERCEQHHRESH